MWDCLCCFCMLNEFFLLYLIGFYYTYVVIDLIFRYVYWDTSCLKLWKWSMLEVFVMSTSWVCLEVLGRFEVSCRVIEEINYSIILKTIWGRFVAYEFFFRLCMETNLELCCSTYLLYPNDFAQVVDQNGKRNETLLWGLLTVSLPFTLSTQLLKWRE